MSKNQYFLFIPHTPLQYEVFNYFAESLISETDFIPICLDLSKDLLVFKPETNSFTISINLDHLIKEVKIDSKKEWLKVVNEFETNFKDDFFSIDWYIDRAIQYSKLGYEEVIELTGKCILALQKLFSNYNIIGAVSEKLLLPQRIIHYLLKSKNCFHYTPIADRFFPRFYFEKEILSWSWHQIENEYQKVSQNQKFTDEVVQVFNKVTRQNFKMILELHKDNSRSSEINHIKKFKSFFSPSTPNIYSRYLLLGKSENLINRGVNFIERIRNRRYYYSIVTRKIPDGKFILFLFHMQPEYTVEGIATHFSIQNSVIEDLSRRIPAGFSIVIKENPKNIGVNYRDRTYYNNLIRMPNIHFLHHEVDSHLLIKKSSAIFTLTGTVGIEAVFFGKPVVTIGNIFYRVFRGIQTADSVKEAAELLISSANKCGDSKINEFEGLSILQSIYNCSYPGRMYNAFAPAVHKAGKNIKLLKSGFLLEIKAKKY